MAVQNYEFNYMPRGEDLSLYPDEKKPNVNILLKNWGLEIDEAILADLQHDVISISGGARLGPFAVSVPVKVPIQIIVTQDSMNPDLSITSHLGELFYLWGSAIKVHQDTLAAQDLNLETLFKSSPDSWMIPYRQGVLGPRDLLVNDESPVGPFPLAVMVDGQFADSFKDREKPLWPKASLGSEDEEVQSPSPEKHAVELAPGKMILTGASTMFQKSVVSRGGHLTFFLNAMDALTLGEDLISIRSKTPRDRGIGRVSRPAKVFWRVFVTLMIPLIIAVMGAVRVILRKKKKHDYLRSLAHIEP